jgi:hypothetical protein
VSRFYQIASEGVAVFIECLSCKRLTKHAVEAGAERTISEGHGEPDRFETYQIVRCKGCDGVSFRIVYRSDDDVTFSPDGDMVYNDREKLYPDRLKRSLADELYLREKIYEVPPLIQAIYRETLQAARHDLNTLAGVGIRSVVEAICRDRGTKEDNLEKKIDELVVMSILTESGAEILHGIRLIGNEAVHESKAPTPQQISAAIKVIDHLLLGVYVLPKEAAELTRLAAAKKVKKPKPKESPPKPDDSSAS